MNADLNLTLDTTWVVLIALLLFFMTPGFAMAERTVPLEECRQHSRRECRRPLIVASPGAALAIAGRPIIDQTILSAIEPA